MPTPQERRGRRVDVLELRVAIRMRGPLAALADRWQAVTPLVEQTSHGRGTHVPAGVVKAVISFARLLHVQRSGDIGSPRVSGSINPSRAAFTPGCVTPST